MTNADSIDGSDDDLLGQLEWVRRLARSLVKDAATADDLAQTVMAKALQSGPVPAHGRRSWLRTTLRNTLANQRRGAAARRYREDGAARAEATVEDPSDVLARAERQQVLVEHVLALPETQREVLLLRYFEDLPPRAIARRLGLPVSTVTTRLQRGRERLRANLESRFGGGWVSALAPLVEVPAGARLVGSALVLRAAFAVIALGLGRAGWTALVQPEPPELRQVERTASVDALPAGGTSLPSVPPPTDTAAGRAAVVDPVELLAPPAPGPASTGAAPTTDVRVVGPSGRPLAGARLLADRACATTDVEGRASFPGLHRDVNAVGTNTVIGVDYREVDATRATLDVVAAPNRNVVVHVVTPAGEPVVGASVVYEIVASSLTSLVDDLGRAALRARSLGRTDENGRVNARVPWLAEATIRAISPRRDVSPWPTATTTLGAAGIDAPEVRIVLEEESVEPPHRILGQAFDDLGEPVAGAAVRLGSSLPTTTEPDGTFELALERSNPIFTASDDEFARRAPRLIATAPSATMAIDDRIASDLRRDPGDRDGVVLRLGGAPLGIEGRVVDEAGAPRAGIGVSLVDPTRHDRLLPGSAERLAGGGPPAIQGPPYVVTDEDGRFALRGLLDRTYRIAAVDAGTSTSVWTDAIAAGARDVEVVLPKNARLPVVRGRVVDEEGRPVPGLRVALERPVVPSVPAIHGASRDFHAILLAEVWTDADGRFVLTDVPEEHAQLALGEIDPTVVEGPFPGDDPTWQVTHEDFRRVVIDLAGGEVLRARYFSLDGAPVRARTLPGRVSTTDPLAIERGVVVEVSGRAKTLALLREVDGRWVESRRVAVDLVPRRLNRLRP